MKDNFEAFGGAAGLPVSPPATSPVDRPVPSLAAALARAQADIVPPLKNRKVDFTDKNGRRVHYNYADLSDVIDAYREPLSKNELSVTHILRYSSELQGGFGMTTELMHSSGEKVSTWYPLPDPMRSEIRAQEFGSALTYARRYSVSALLGIASEEDDDGAEASPANPKPSGHQSPIKPQAVVTPARQAPGGLELQGQEARPPSALAPSLAQIKRLFAISNNRGWSDDQVKEYLGLRWKIASTKDLTRDRYDALISVIESKSFPQACVGLISEPQV